MNTSKSKPRTSDGEIAVAVSQSDDYERMVKPDTIELPFDEIDCSTSIECGFRVEHLSATSKTMEIDLTSGAGCGSRWISGSVKNKETGKTRYFRVDASKMLTAILTKMLGEEVTIG